VFTNLTPYIPLSFKGEGEEIYREGFHPSLTCTGALNSLPLLMSNPLTPPFLKGDLEGFLREGVRGIGC